jgi:hypothetical protein
MNPPPAKSTSSPLAFVADLWQHREMLGQVYIAGLSAARH